MTKKKLGRISAIWRYPVKSMAGELLDSCVLTERGLLGDRAYALVDEATGKVASAKNPRVWPDLFLYTAAFVQAPELDRALPAVRIVLPDGTTVAGEVNGKLSSLLGRRVTLTRQPPPRPVLQQYWPDDGRVTDEAMPAGTFFDLALVNVLLTTTLDRLSTAYPEGNFDIRRFRPNIVITPEAGIETDPEIASVGGTITLGDVARLRIDSRCGRCVMTTLEQPGLPKDVGILRTVARANEGFAGLNSTVIQPGTLRIGDAVWLSE